MIVLLVLPLLHSQGMCAHLLYITLLCVFQYWIEARKLSSTFNQLNLLNGAVTELFNSNYVKRIVMGPGGIGSRQLTAALIYDVLTDHIWMSAA